MFYPGKKKAPALRCGAGDRFWNPFKSIKVLSKRKKRPFDYYRIPALEPLFAELFTPVQQIELEIQKKVERWVPDWKESARKAYAKKREEWNEGFEKAGKKLANGLKHSLKQGLRISLASASLFGIGFVVMNAPAYADLVKTSVLTWSGAPEDTRLEEHFVKVNAIEQDILTLSNNPDTQKETLPSLTLAVTPPDNRLIIPKLNKNIPIIESDPQKLLNADWETLENTFQEDLKKGVLHYPGTAEPGQAGTAFITGHSSYYLWDSGRYKSVFARLNQLQTGDDIIVYYDQQKYHYKVREKKEVKKEDVSVLTQTDEHLLTLMTCAPLGTNLRRLIVVAEQFQE